MAVAPPTTPPALTPATATTRRGFATAAFCLACWGTAVFWWYPFGMAITGVALVFSAIALALNIRAGKDGEHLALYAVGVALTGQGLAWASYRFMMLAFEGQPGFEWLPINIYG
jgi:hypothetical protein